MRPLILAFHAGHNASALIGDETGILHAVQEERLCREKNFWGFPKLAIAACLERVGAKPSEVAAVVCGGRQLLPRYHSREDVLEAYRRQDRLLGRLRQRLAMPLALRLMPRMGQESVRRQIEQMGFVGGEVTHFDHHRTHAATAYYGLRRDPESSYLVLTCDGDGDGLCATVRVMGGGREEVLATTPWDSSLGTIYSWVTFRMGFVPLEHEYKLMGMAPYASPRHAAKATAVFRRFLGLAPGGLAFRRGTRRRTNDVSRELFRRLDGERFDNVCAGLQTFTEELLTAWADKAVEASGCPRLLAAGGVFMNVKANQQIAALEGVESFEAFPSCGDETLPLGAYYLEAARRFGDAAVPPLEHFYLGDEPGGEDVPGLLQGTSWTARHLPEPTEMAAAVAELLVAGKPVARCAGAMEFGARALGNRSILADPRNPDVVRVINQMIKKRDFWMPFAPMVAAERQHEYLVNPKGLRSPYMMMTFDTRENFTDLIAAVHNADLTCRAQILERDQNPAMYAILEAFAERTGRGVVLNTSFNLHGFPIVRTAAEALEVFADSGLEYLQVGDWLVGKG